MRLLKKKKRYINVLLNATESNNLSFNNIRDMVKLHWTNTAFLRYTICVVREGVLIQELLPLFLALAFLFVDDVVVTGGQTQDDVNDEGDPQGHGQPDHHLLLMVQGLILLTHWKVKLKNCWIFSIYDILRFLLRVRIPLNFNFNTLWRFYINQSEFGLWSNL